MGSPNADPFGLNLERDMPLTEADFEALDRARDLKPLSPEAERQWLELLENHHRDNINSDSDEPFTLP